ncbi:MAG: methyl-accepting chemotaxis protein [Lachnospiraceae bacterium]|nr:methyl-accepting chemotaxis protein [Lachnospiraceae bacterium]
MKADEKAIKDQNAADQRTSDLKTDGSTSASENAAVDEKIAEEEAISKLNKELKKEQARKDRLQAKEDAKKAKKEKKEAEKTRKQAEKAKRKAWREQNSLYGNTEKDTEKIPAKKRSFRDRDISKRLSAITGLLILLSYTAFVLIVEVLTSSIIKSNIDREMYLTVTNSSVKLENALLNVKQGDKSFDTKFVSVVTNTTSDYSTLKMAVVNRTGKVLYSESNGDVGKDIQNIMSKRASVITSGLKGRVKFKAQTGSEWAFFVPMNAAGQNVWLIGRISSNEAGRRIVRLIIILTVLGFVAFASLTLVIRYMIKKSLKPLNDIQDVASLIARGNFDVSISYDRQDEIGRLASALQDFIDRLRQIINDIGKRLSDFSDGNLVLDEENKDYYIGAYASIRTSIEEIADGLNHTISEIRHASDQVATGSSQVSSGAQSLAQSSTEQASSIEKLSQTMQNISDKISETADMTSEAASISKESEDAVGLTNEKMKEMTSSMKEITGKANEISKIIQTIDDIAFQTNILALNASIEAARAGSAGKGFAVVAGEVGNLAKKSQEAAQGTAKLIEDTIAAVGKGATITSDTEVALEKVSDSFVHINGLISKIQTASMEENNSIKQAADGLNQISAVVQTNSATAEESAAAAEALSSQAETMKELVGVFRLDEKKK